MLLTTLDLQLAGASEGREGDQLKGRCYFDTNGRNDQQRNLARTLERISVQVLCSTSASAMESLPDGSPRAPIAAAESVDR